MTENKPNLSKDPIKEPEKEQQPKDLKAGAKKDYSTPGALLRRNREMRHMSIEDASKQLLLSKKIIADLENDDFGHIAAPTYARGYLRAYAQLLRIPENQILDAFEKLNPEIGSHEKFKSIQYHTPEHAMIYQKIRWITYSIFAFLIFSIVAWVWGEHGNNKNLPTVAQENTSIEQVAPLSPSTASDAVSPQSTSAAAEKGATLPAGNVNVDGQSSLKLVGSEEAQPILSTKPMAGSKVKTGRGINNAIFREKQQTLKYSNTTDNNRDASIANPTTTPPSRSSSEDTSVNLPAINQ